MAITYELDGAVAHARMDDGKANVINAAFLDDLDVVLSLFVEDGVGALVLWGREGFFSGGIDMAVFDTPDVAERSAVLQRIAHTILDFWTAPLPTIAAVTGHAIAGGAVLAMACDYRVAADVDAWIGLTETAIGLVLPTWAMVVAQAALRADRWNETILFARRYLPNDARKMGFVDEVVTHHHLERRVREVAEEAAALPTPVFAAVKRRLHREARQRAAARVEKEMTADFLP